MGYWQQITTYPSLLLGPILAAAIVSGAVSVWIARQSRRATSDDVDRKIVAEREITDAKLAHERDTSLTERAWADYGLRRDIYLSLAAQIDCLFGAAASAPTTPAVQAAAKKAFHETARKVRLIGSDEVVNALNHLTASIKSRAGQDVVDSAYSSLMNAIRRDIRTLNEKPPVGTTLDESAFPIES